MSFPVLMKKQTAAMSLLSASGLLILSGCSVLLENPADGALAISRDGGQLRVVVCTAFEASEVRMSERSNAGEWSYFWTFAKDIEIAAGDEVSPSFAGELGVEPAREPKIDPDDDIRIVFADGTNSVTAQFTVPETGLPDDAWVHPNGDTTQQPCD